MDAWIESASGNLLNAASIINITVKESTPGGMWEIIACTDHKSASFATALPDRATARTVRNALAMAMSAACRAGKFQMICFEPVTGTVCVEDLA